MSEWKELWLNNYKGIGDTAELTNHLKKLGYGSRMDVTYLPWAVVERIFKLQDGVVEWLPTLDGTHVDFDSLVVGEESYEENGITVSKPTRVNSYFINVRAKWHGQEYTERYPLQDSNGRALTRWTQNELNKAYQRGKVKAIAIVSGIGYKLFEDGDLQFEETPEPPKTEELKPKPKPKPKPKTKEESYKPPHIDELIQPKEDKPLIIENEEIPEDRNKKEQDIKRVYLSGEEKANAIKKYLVEKNATKVGDLTDEDLNILYVRVC